MRKAIIVLFKVGAQLMELQDALNERGYRADGIRRSVYFRAADFVAEARFRVVYPVRSRMMARRARTAAPFDWTRGHRMPAVRFQDGYTHLNQLELDWLRQHPETDLADLDIPF